MQNYYEQGLGVYNLAVSSNNTRNVLKFLESDINKIDTIEFDDYILLFSIGINDSRYLGRLDNVFVPQDEFENNLQKIIGTAKNYSKQIFFTGLIQVDENLLKSLDENEFWENENIKKYDEIIAKMCKEHQIHFIPLIDLINESDLFDGLHPNAKGHEKIYNRVKEHLGKHIFPLANWNSSFG